MITVELRRNHFPQLRALCAIAAQARNAEAADKLRAMIVDAMNSGEMPIQPDTGALSASWFVATGGAIGQSSDYEQRVAAAGAAYTEGFSRWKEAVREKLHYVVPEPYSAGHFAERVAAFEGLTPRTQAASALVGSMLAYATWWNDGHWNWFTEREEHRPLLDTVVAEFRTIYHLFFEDLLRVTV